MNFHTTNSTHMSPNWSVTNVTILQNKIDDAWNLLGLAARIGFSFAGLGLAAPTKLSSLSDRTAVMISISGWGRSVLTKGKRPKERIRRECKRTLLTPKSPETYKQEGQIKIRKTFRLRMTSSNDLLHTLCNLNLSKCYALSKGQRPEGQFSSILAGLNRHQSTHVTKS